MMYNMAGCYLEFFQWLQMTTIEKRIDLVTAKVSLYFQISIDMRFPESSRVQVVVKMNWSVIFVYILGTKYGK